MAGRSSGNPNLGLRLTERGPTESRDTPSHQEADPLPNDRTRPRHFCRNPVPLPANERTSRGAV